MPHTTQPTQPEPAKQPAPSPAPLPVSDAEFAERHDDPAQAEELERQQDA